MTIITRKGKALRPAHFSVLIVDDQHFYCSLLNEILRAMGITKLEIAHNGKEALQCVERSTPDVIICDWVMPEMNGLELVKKIRRSKNERLRQVPMIMVTSNNLRSQIEEARNAGVDTFILKPISTKAVFDRLKEVVETPRDFIESENYTGPCRRSRRPIADYSGPFRRINDPMELSVGIHQEKRIRDLIRRKLSLINGFIPDIKAENFSFVSAMGLTIQEIMGLAHDIDDIAIGKVCWSLNTYIEKSAQAQKIRFELVEAHLKSLELLIDTPFSKTELRESLIHELHNVVTKSLHAA